MLPMLDKYAALAIGFTLITIGALGLYESLGAAAESVPEAGGGVVMESPQGPQVMQTAGGRAPPVSYPHLSKCLYSWGSYPALLTSHQIATNVSSDWDCGFKEDCLHDVVGVLIMFLGNEGFATVIEDPSLPRAAFEALGCNSPAGGGIILLSTSRT